MALPTTGTITLQQVATELGVSLPLSLNDSRVRALAGKPTGNISLNDLRGKSAGPTITVFVSSFSDESAGLNRRRDVVYMSVNWTGNVAPTSYSWATSSAMTTITGGTTRTPTIRGQAYSPMNSNYTESVEIGCNILIGGTTYYGSTWVDITMNGDM